MVANRCGARGILAAAVFVFVTGLAASAQSGRPPTPSDKVDALSEAARKGDVAAVRKLLDEGVDVNTKFRYDRTALAFASDRGHIEVVKLLLERGADVNIEDTFYHATPLSWAVNPAMGKQPQHAEIVGLILKRNPKGKEGALIAAVSGGDLAMTKVILDSGALPAGTLSDALAAATRRNNKEMVTLLEQAGAKPRVEVKIDPAQLTKYAGTYSGVAGIELVVTVSDGRLRGAVAAQRFTFVARDQTTFGVEEAPGLTVTFKIEGDVATTVTVGQGGGAQTYARVQGK